MLESLEGRCVPTTVTNLNDAGAGSLRQAILDTPSGGIVDFQPDLSGTITLTSGQLSIAKDLTLAGPGADVITVSGNNTSRVFSIAATDTVDISGLTVADGKANPSGGGISNAGVLSVSNVVIRDNAISFPGLGGAGMGGGIYNSGQLTVSCATFLGNSATAGFALNGNPGEGGGLYNGGTATVANSTFANNSASGGSGGSGFNRGLGGGIDNTGTLDVIDATLAANSARGLDAATGAGIENTGTLTLTSATVSRNAANASGGLAQGAGIHNAGRLSLDNTIVAMNTAASGPDISGGITSLGYNLIGNGTGGSGYDATDLVGTADDPIDPLLGALQENGGPTPTMAPAPGSPALNAGDPSQLGGADQRGVVRAGGVNMGAYQASATAFILSAPAKVTAGVPFDLTVTAVDPFGQIAVGYGGTVTFRTTDPSPGVVLPADYTFTPADGGLHSFTDTGSGETTLATRGHQTITATDISDGSITGSVTIKVRHARRAAPPGVPASNAPDQQVTQPVPPLARLDEALSAAEPVSSESAWGSVP